MGWDDSSLSSLPATEGPRCLHPSGDEPLLRAGGPLAGLPPGVPHGPAPASARRSRQVLHRPARRAHLHSRPAARTSVVPSAAPIFRLRRRAMHRESTAMGVLEAPAEVPAAGTGRGTACRSWKSATAAGRELVTVIELLSPSNKRTGEDREHIWPSAASCSGAPPTWSRSICFEAGRAMPAEAEAGVRLLGPGESGRRRPIRRLLADPALLDRLPGSRSRLRHDVADARVDLQETLHRAQRRTGLRALHLRRRATPRPLGRGRRLGACVPWMSA